MADALSNAEATLAQTAGAQEGIEKMIVARGSIAKYTFNNFVPRTIFSSAGQENHGGHAVCHR